MNVTIEVPLKFVPSGDEVFLMDIYLFGQGRYSAQKWIVLADPAPNNRCRLQQTLENGDVITIDRDTPVFWSCSPLCAKSCIDKMAESVKIPESKFWDVHVVRTTRIVRKYQIFALNHEEASEQALEKAANDDFSDEDNIDPEYDVEWFEPSKDTNVD